MELYNNPANTFVAGFIGSPQMNFLDAAALGAPGKTLGIRPEHLDDRRREAGADPRHHQPRRAPRRRDQRLRPHRPARPPHRAPLRRARYAVDEAVHLTPDPARAFHFDDDGRRLAA